MENVNYGLNTVSKQFEAFLIGYKWRGCRNVLTMDVVLRPDVTSSLWFLIGPHHPTLTLNADWSNITITEYRRGYSQCMTPGTLNEREMLRSLQITWSLDWTPSNHTCDTLPHQTKSCPYDFQQPGGGCFGVNCAIFTDLSEGVEQSKPHHKFSSFSSPIRAILFPLPATTLYWQKGYQAVGTSRSTLFWIQNGIEHQKGDCKYFYPYFSFNFNWIWMPSNSAM